MDKAFIKRELAEMKNHIAQVWEGKEDISLLSLNKSFELIEKELDKDDNTSTNGNIPSVGDDLREAIHSIEESLKKILFSTTCSDGFCNNPACEQAVVQLPETGRWYITFGHAGFNSKANNGRGYATKNSALAAVKRFWNHS